MRSRPFLLAEGNVFLGCYLCASCENPEGPHPHPISSSPCRAFKRRNSSSSPPLLADAERGRKLPCLGHSTTLDLTLTPHVQDSELVEWGVTLDQCYPFFAPPSGLVSRPVAKTLLLFQSLCHSKGGGGAAFFRVWNFSLVLATFDFA